jgi:UDP-glucose 4-epimerase
LEFRVLRIANAFGPFQVPVKRQGVISALVSRTISNERCEIWGDGSVVRDYIFVDDVMDAAQAAANDRSTERTFNIGSGRGRSLLEVIATVEHLLNVKLKVDWQPSRPLDIARSVLAIDRARSVLNWVPGTPFEQGLRRTIEWWNSVHGGAGRAPDIRSMAAGSCGRTGISENASGARK